MWQWINLEKNVMNQPRKTKVTIYTDGACSGNPGPGGWGVYLVYGKISKEILGYDVWATNNQMEMQAAIEALKALKKSCTIDLYTDSKYLQLGITQWIHNWKKNNWRTSSNKPVKNEQLWRDLATEIAKHDITWHWVKGHGDNYGNIVADRLATSGRDMAKQKNKR